MRNRLRHWMSTQTDRLSMGLTGYAVIHRRAGVALRYYAPAATPTGQVGPGRPPLVLVPPLEMDPRVYDQRHDNSLIAYLSACDFDVYLVDWGRTNHAAERRSLADYFAALLPEMLNRVRFHSGQHRLLLHGWRTGGLLALCHAALRPADGLAGLVLLDTCIDHETAPPDPLFMHHGSVSESWRQWAGRRARQWSTASRRLPGWMQSAAYRTVTGLVAGDARASPWLRACPSGVMADIVDYLWSANVLAAGRLPMLRPGNTLADVTAPILYVTDARHPVCSPDCGRLLATHAFCCPIRYETVHSDEAQAACGALMAYHGWSRIVDWLAGHRTSDPDGD